MHKALTLPYPPSANRYWRCYRGVMVKSGEARKYYDDVQVLSRAAGLFPEEAANVKVELAFFRPARRGDLDNRLKIILDSLQGIAYQDDKQVKEIHATMSDDKKNPRVEVKVRRVNEIQNRLLDSE